MRAKGLYHMYRDLHRRVAWASLRDAVLHFVETAPDELKTTGPAELSLRRRAVPSHIPPLVHLADKVEVHFVELELVCLAC